MQLLLLRNCKALLNNVSIPHHESAGMMGRATSLASLLACGVAFSALATTAYANPVLPTGGTVTHGAASFARGAGSLTINQTSAKAIIDWTGFDIGAGGTVQIDNGSGATLNRVIGTGVSAIDGALNATGSVFLINPNGVIIGKAGVVKTGGSFVASTLGITDANFLGAGAHVFSGSATASVINLGRVGSLGGNVALIAAQVGNSGNITAPQGDVGLIAGQRVVMQDSLLDNGMFLVQTGGSATAVTDTGGITAAAAELRANGGNIYALAGNSTGVIKATGIGTRGGHVWIVADGAGKTTVSAAIAATKDNGDGGLVETSGASVDFTGARINTMGTTGKAGTWLVDPTNLTIDAAAAATISANLATSDVTLQTNADGTTSGPGSISVGAGNIYVNNGVTWASANTLTLSSYRDIVVGANVTSTGGGGVNLYADNSGRGVGTVRFVSGAKISTGGAVTIYYNPSSNHYTATPSVNATSYHTANNFVPDVAGGGTLTAYMLVNNVFDLQNIGNNLDSNYALGRDIDASSTASWNAGAGFIPIGSDGAGTILNSNFGFTGYFDGQNHTISGLTINRPAAQYVGLFGAIGIKSPDYYIKQFWGNIKLTNVNIIGKSYVGAVIGKADIASSIYPFLTNITVSGFISGSLSTGENIGGIIGIINGGYIYLCSSSGTVKGYENVGGVFGQSISVTDSFLSSSSTVDGYFGVGGLIGYAQDDLSNSFATGAVTGVVQVGGLIGTGDGLIYGAYSSGTVSVSSGASGQYIGGLEGAARDYSAANVYSTSTIIAPNSTYIGGIAGTYIDAGVTDGYFAGKINAAGSQFVGALVGYLDDYYHVYVRNVKWDKTVLGSDITVPYGGVYSNSLSSSVEGLTTDQLQDFSAYSTNYSDGSLWNFSTVWAPPAQAGQVGQNKGYYPQLFALTPVVVVQASTTTKVYGNNNPDLGSYVAGGPATYGFGQKTDSLPLANLFSTTATATSSTGNYAITPSGVNSVTSTQGVVYRVISDAAGASLQITARQVSVEAQPESSIYGNTVPALAYSVAPADASTGLVNGDTLTGALATSATATANVGSYAITQGSLAATANYNLIYTGALETITPRTVSVNALPTTNIYGNTVPALQYSVTPADANSGLVNGDTLSGALATTASPTANVGQYAITQGTLAASPNYNLQYTGAFATITPRYLYVTALRESVGAGQPIPTLAYTVARKRANTGLVNGDSLTGALATAATPSSSVGKYAITLGSLAATPNYDLVYTGASLTIHP